MWLLICKSDHTVRGVSYQYPAPGSYDSDLVEIKEWQGMEPTLHNADPDDPQPSYDPTLTDPGYADFVDASSRFDELYQHVGEEIAWLEDALDVVDDADLATLRIILKHVLRENLQMLRAWRYVAKRFNRS